VVEAEAALGHHGGGNNLGWQSLLWSQEHLLFHFSGSFHFHVYNIYCTMMYVHTYLCTYIKIMVLRRFPKVVLRKSLWRKVVWGNIIWGNVVWGTVAWGNVVWGKDVVPKICNPSTYINDLRKSFISYRKHYVA
jgi:hypothetical protein